MKSGSARVFGYSVFRGVLNRVYGILQLKYGYSVYHFLNVYEASPPKENTVDFTALLGESSTDGNKEREDSGKTEQT